MKLAHTITKEDVGAAMIPDRSTICPTCGAGEGRIWTVNLMGGIMKIDIGKRIYRSKPTYGSLPIYQVENNEQRDKRLANCG